MKIITDNFVFEGTLEEWNGFIGDKTEANDYYGIDFSLIDNKYKWIAIDEDGFVFAYTMKPEIDPSTYEWSGNASGDHNYIHRLEDMTNINLKETLMEINR